MKAFLDSDFLLQNDTAKVLYHEYAVKMPIYDYHCHLSAKDIAEDKKYRNITELWLSGDHYKWRAMRSNGVDESYITGNQSDKEKFLKFAETVERAIGNPLYHWTHLELKRYFDIQDVMTKANAEDIWDRCNSILTGDDFSAKNLIQKSNVKVICTTDDPVDDLRYHMQIAKDSKFDVKVLPTFRPDKGLNVDGDSFLPWIKELERISGNVITSFDDLVQVLKKRIDYFHQWGCRISDHSLEIVMYDTPNLEKANQVFLKVIKGEKLQANEIEVYKGTLLHHLGKKYKSLGWTMQIHIGALRNNSSRMFKTVGPDAGFDSINDHLIAEKLSRLMDDLDLTDELPKTILYVLNPRDNYVIGTMIGNFQNGSDGIKGKIQFGSGWWFNDQRDGMESQLKSLANLGLLSNFVGMLTDSRSFTSYPRHEYFRRILCNLLGQWVEDGEFPDNIELLGSIVQDICYNNAVNYFGIA